MKEKNMIYLLVIEGIIPFDARQYPHLVWKDGEDLKEQVLNRIRVIV